MSKYLVTLIVGVYFLMMATVAQSGQAAIQLPEGNGKELVQGMCTACHELNLITRSSGYSREAWRELIGTMINLSGTPAQDTITQYLATHFPANDQLKPTLVRGEASITFREWTVPTPGQRARDPVQTPDGSIWWAGQVWQYRREDQPEDWGNGGNTRCRIKPCHTASRRIVTEIFGTLATAMAPWANSIRAPA